MYIPDHFRMPESDVEAFLARPRAGTLITVDPSTGRPEASFLPWTVLDGDRLTSHVGRVNPQSKHSGQALVVLMGDDAYVCQQWMKPGAVPTWNYETVQLSGELICHREPEWIIQSWDDMLRRFSDSDIGAYDHDWLVKMARTVTGIEVRVTEIQAKSKLSQNRVGSEIETITDQLESRCPHMAARMRHVSAPHAAAREERVRLAEPYATRS